MIDADPKGFAVEATSHTLESSIQQEFEAGRRVNLERALRLGDRLGGHIVQGHVDGIGRVTRIQYKEGSNEIQVDLEPDLLKLMAPQGSVALNGVSLTIAEKSSHSIKLVIIPSTLLMTTLGELKPGSRVNIESDLIIRWIADRLPTGDPISPAGQSISGRGIFHMED